jgi:hypothetical protein
VAVVVRLVAPASAADVFDALLSAGLTISPNNGSGGSNREPREVINATYAGWPLTLSSFSSAEALGTVGGFEPGAAPGAGDAPYSFAGLNVLVEFGPSTDGELPAAPELRFAAAAGELVDALWPVIGPLAQSAAAPIELPLDTSGAGDGGTALSPSPVP